MEITGFENIHVHSDYSVLDGMGKVEEYGERAKKINQRFLCITDHGMMGAVPEQIKVGEELGLKPIYGIELYVNPMQPETNDSYSSSDFAKNLNDEERARFKKSYHLLAIAHNEKGYSNLVKLSSWGWLKGYYYKPRVNHEMLMRHKEGITFSSCCYNGEIGQAFDRKLPDLTEAYNAGYKMMEKYKEMFGDNFYLEFMLLDFSKQKPYNEFIIKAHQKYNIPLVVTGDCHYTNPDDSNIQRLMLMLQTKRTLKDIQNKMDSGDGNEFFELQDKNLWLKSEEELNNKWSSDYKDIIEYDYFAEAKRNTVRICEMSKNVNFDRSLKLPELPHADEKLKEFMVQGFQKRNLPKTREYLDRLAEEYNLICMKGFSSYFLIQKMITDEARRVSPSILGWGNGSEAVGDGRGSCVGSLICYCLGITGVNPIKHDLLFSRFLSPARGGVSLKLKF